MNRSLTSLRTALLDPITPHLNDETMAEIAAAEAAGENVDILYPANMLHLAQCPVCTKTYGELASFWQTAVSDMSVAAQTITPQQAYLALLQKETTYQVDVADLEAAALPLRFPQPPDTLAAFDAALANTTIPPQSEHIMQAARRNLTALAAFLAGASAAIWGKSLEVKTAVFTKNFHVTFQPAPPAAMPVLSSSETGAEWQIMSRRVEASPVTWHVSARARRESATTCTLLIHADRPGLTDAADRAITIAYDLETKTPHTTTTDATGTAAFPHIPIAALPTLSVTIDTPENAA